MIREAIAMYRARDAAFGPMPEPQWRILIDLSADGDCDISSACIASGAAMTTALRHIQLLEATGLVARHPDQFDRRRWWLSLTDEAVNRFALFEKPAGHSHDATASAAERLSPLADGGATQSPALSMAGRTAEASLSSTAGLRGASHRPVHAAADAAARQEDHHG
jgi:DNA-binding MarR family transcriptional regulator